MTFFYLWNKILHENISRYYTLTIDINKHTLHMYLDGLPVRPLSRPSRGVRPRPGNACWNLLEGSTFPMAIPPIFFLPRHTGLPTNEEILDNSTWIILGLFRCSLWPTLIRTVRFHNISLMFFICGNNLIYTEVRFTGVKGEYLLQYSIFLNLVMLVKKVSIILLNYNDHCSRWMFCSIRSPKKL